MHTIGERWRRCLSTLQLQMRPQVSSVLYFSVGSLIPYWIQSFHNGLLNTLSFIQDNKMETNYLVDYIIVQNFDLEQRHAYPDPDLIHFSAQNLYNALGDSI